MAGAGYKLYSTGDVLTASDVNTYIQQQTVMVFADASARTTALTGVVAEGMLTYLKDTDVVQYYSGSGWVTVNTDQTPLTTKGDLFTYSTQDARLAVGNNGESLVADSGATTGLRWTATPSASNPVINGGMDIWQRGTANITTGNAYTADRWQKNAGTHYGVSRQTTSDTTNLPFIQYCARVQRGASSTSTAGIELVQNMESVNSIPYAGKTVTVSFYARKGADYSAASSLLNVSLYTGTGTDQNLIISPYFSGSTQAISVTATLTTTWQRFTGTATLASTVTQMAVYAASTPTGTAGTNDYFEITGVQIDVGSVALPFRRAMNTLAGELVACQRYYYLHASGNALSIANAGYYSATQVNGMVHFPVQMRTAPTLSASSGTDYYVADRNGGSDNLNSFTIYRPSTTTAMLYNSSEASGTAGHAALLYTNNASSSIAFSAEL